VNGITKISLYVFSWNSTALRVAHPYLYQWDSPTVVGSLATAVISAVAFLIVELFIAPEPIMAPFLLKQRIPLLVGASNFLVANCNFAVMYFFPLWFQTVMLTKASTAGRGFPFPQKSIFG